MQGSLLLEPATEPATVVSSCQPLPFPGAQASVARPAHLVDISDLPPELPRKEVRSTTCA